MATPRQGSANQTITRTPEMSIMFVARNSIPICRMVLALVCLLGLCGLAWSQNPQPAKPSGNRSVLQNDPALRVMLTVHFKRPKAQDILDRLRTETKVDLVLADNIDREREVLGSLSCQNMPAWLILEQLAKSQIIQGKWERDGNGYRLTSPLPPPVPANAEPPPPPGPAKLGFHYFLFALPLIAVFGIVLLIRYRRRSQKTASGAEQPIPASKKSPSSVGRR